MQFEHYKCLSLELKMSNLGLFVLEVAKSENKTVVMPVDKAQEIHDNLSNQIFSKIEEIRNVQRRAVEESLNITIF